MTSELQTAMIMTAPLLLQMAGLTFSVLSDTYIRREHRKVFLIVIVLVVSLIAQNVAEYPLVFRYCMPMLRTAVSCYGYSVRPVILVLFCYLISQNMNHGICWALAAVNMVIHLSSFFSGVCFKITEENYFQRGPLGFTSFIISGILLLYGLYLITAEYKTNGRKNFRIPLINVLMIVVTVIVDVFVIQRTIFISVLTIAIVSSCVFFYIWLHQEIEKQHEKALLAEQRIKIMISQIQPHFLYNALSTIQALCRIDPEKAFDTTEKFGTYLRQNIDSLNQPGLIPLENELEHTKIYAEIEMVRFPNIHIEYDIKDKEYSLPALTIQPLVENAIRHGVRIRKDGMVTVTTRRTEGFHQIVIRDNGKGFDPKCIDGLDDSHIGLRNVQERIRRMCGGTMKIESGIGEGTSVTVRIPCMN